MKINQYKKKTSLSSFRSLELNSIFQNIKTNNIDTQKSERRGNVFAATTSKGRKHEDIKTFTGLLFIDLDNCIDHVEVKQFFIQLDHTVAVWYSSSGKNVHALIKIPICKDIAEFKRRHKAFLKQVKPYIKTLAIIDTITSNPTQLAFESYDPKIYVNTNPITFQNIAPKPKKIKPPKVIPMATTKTEEYCSRWLIDSIASITTNGYPQLLKYAQTIGGYSSGGYISQSLAKETLIRCIESNPYFNSNESQGSISTYLKGGIASFENGLTKPLVWASK